VIESKFWLRGPSHPPTQTLTKTQLGSIIYSTGLEWTSSICSNV